jgi:hypothetical protein
MNKKNDEYLTKNFPLLYCDRNGNMQETCMCWGFDVGDGWFDLIKELSEKLEPLVQQWINENPKPEDAEEAKMWYHPCASQVKEKFGGLRFYLSCGTDEMYDLCHEAERKSYTICENCGAPGKERGGGWIFTLCDICNEKKSAQGNGQFILHPKG